MKMKKLLVIAIAAVCLFACLPAVSAISDQTVAPSTGIHSISEDFAKDSVRNFMGDQTLNPVFTTIGTITDNGFGTVRCYVIEVTNSVFYVNRNNGVVEVADFKDAMPLSPPEIKFSRDQAYAKAMGSPVLKYEGVSEKTWSLIIDKMAGPAGGIQGYVFAFQEKDKSGSLLPHVVIISVNPETGGIIRYHNANHPDPSEAQAFSKWLENLDKNIKNP
jgi:hypothetical protein